MKLNRYLPARFFRIRSLKGLTDRARTEFPPEVVRARGMLSKAERRLIYGLMKYEYEGIGAVVDGGSFMGSSAVSIAQGLRDNRRLHRIDKERFPDQRPIHAYELGVLPWLHPEKPAPVRNFGTTEYRLGESFIPILSAELEPYSDLVSLHSGDLMEREWPDVPIELAFIDVCKTAELNAHVTRQFITRLIAKKSVFINQDFFFDRLPFIKVTMGYLSEYFHWAGQVQTSSVYIPIKPVPLDVASYDPFLENDSRCVDFHDMYDRESLDDERRFLMDLSKSYLLASLGRRNDAMELASSLPETFKETFDIIRARMAVIDRDRDGPPRDADFRVKRAMNQIRHGRVPWKPRAAA